MGKAIINDFNPQIIVELANSLKPYALALTKNPIDAKDLVQETIYRALGNQEKFSDGTNLKACLLAIMKNTFINNYRRSVKHNTILDATVNAYYLNHATDVAYNLGESNLGIESIQNAINNLAEEFRIPFLMHKDGFKYQEIADDLDLPIGTVKSRIFLARRQLKRLLES